MKKETKKAPTIRFREFTDDWEQRKVGEFYDFKNGLNKNKEFFGTGVPIVNFTDVFHNRGLTAAQLEGRVTLEPNEIKNYRVKKGDIFFTRTSETIEEIGYPSVMLDTPENTVFSGFVLRGRCFSGNDPLDNLFKQYVFFTQSFRDEMKKKSSMTTRALTSGTSIKEMLFQFPSSKNEQHQIGKCITKFDNLITLHQRKLDQLKALKKYFLQNMFPTKGEKVPRIRFKGFTGDWEQRKLGELSLSFEYGLNAAAKKYDGKNKYIRITDINDNSRLFEQENVTSPDTDLSSAENYKLSERDILFARTGASVGKSYIYRASDGCVYYAGFLVRARIKPEYNPEFIFQNTLTADYKKFITVTSMRSGQPGVNAQEYSQYQILIPSNLEQDKISRYLRNIDNLITLHQRKLDQLQTMKKFMLQNLFI